MAGTESMLEDKTIESQPCFDICFCGTPWVKHGKGVEVETPTGCRCLGCGKSFLVAPNFTRKLRGFPPLKELALG